MTTMQSGPAWILATSLLLCQALLSCAGEDEQVCEGESTIGPRSPSEFSAVGFEVDWTGAENALEPDGAEAVVDLAPGQVSRKLVVTGFGFDLPPDAVLTSITAEVMQAGDGSLDTQFMGLFGDDFSTGNDVYGVSAPWSAEPAYRVYDGRGEDLWGQGSTFTPQMANDPTFSAAIAVANRGEEPAQARVDHVQLTIAYTAGGVAGTAGPRSATSTSQLQLLRTWEDMEEVAQEDDQCARVNAMTYKQLSELLLATGYGFRLPDDAIITGIQVDVRKRASYNVDDHIVRLVSAGEPVGEDQAKRINWWPQEFEVFTYGGPGALWGREWTVAEINDPGFGVAFGTAYRVVSGNGSAELDHIRLTVYATCPQEI